VSVPLVQTASIERAEQSPVERVDLHDAAHFTLEEEAVVTEAAFPARLHFLGDAVETFGNLSRNRVGPFARRQKRRIEKAADRPRLDDVAVVARRQPVDAAADLARL